MANLEFAEVHNLVAFLKKVNEHAEFHEIVDFLKSSHLNFALTTNPTIYTQHIRDFWGSAKLVSLGGVKTIQATVDKKPINITETTIRQCLQLNDENGIDQLPAKDLFEELPKLGYEGPLNQLTFYKPLFSSQWKFLIHTLLQCMSQKRTSWNEMNSSIATAVICLSQGKIFNWSKLIFDGLVWNLNPKHKRFLMYPRFLQTIFNQELEGLSIPLSKWILSSHKAKVFAYMKGKNEKFSGVITPLTASMLGAIHAQGEGSGSQPAAEPTPTPTTNIPQSQSNEPVRYQRKAKRAKVSPLSPPIIENVAEENISGDGGDVLGRAASTEPSLEAGQDRSNISKTQPKATSTISTPMDVDIPEGSQNQEKRGGLPAQTRFEGEPNIVHDSQTGGQTSVGDEASFSLKELTELYKRMAKRMKLLQTEVKEQKQIIQQQQQEIDALKRIISTQGVKTRKRGQVIDTSSTSTDDDLDKFEFKKTPDSSKMGEKRTLADELKDLDAEFGITRDDE